MLRMRLVRLARLEPPRLAADMILQVTLWRIKAFLVSGSVCWLMVCMGGCDNSARGRVAVKFDKARSALHRGEFETARRQLNMFIEKHSDHHLAGRATFLCAKSYVGLEDFDNARLWFRRTIQRFPGAEEAHKAKFKLAMLDLLSDQPALAKVKLQELLEAADGPYVPEARAFVTYLENHPEGMAVP